MIDLKSIKSKHQYADPQADGRTTVRREANTFHCFIPESWVIEKSFVGGCLTEKSELVLRPKKRMMDIQAVEIRNPGLNTYIGGSHYSS